MKKLINVNYISCWDGCEDIVSAAKLDTNTGVITEIETLEVSEEYEICLGEFIDFGDNTIEEVVCNDSEYTIISKTDYEYHCFNIHGTNYTVSIDTTKDDIHRILGIAKESKI